MSKHTPGPWIVEDRDSTGLIVRWSDPNSQICVMRWTDGLRPEVEEIVMADARLIAAAPELLDACKRVLVSLEALETMGVKNNQLDQLRAAIAKAEGGEG